MKSKKTISNQPKTYEPNYRRISEKLYIIWQRCYVISRRIETRVEYKL